jgi:hypothetical protein
LTNLTTTCRRRRSVGTLDAFIPERWALETLALLTENMGVAAYVNRDYEDDFREFGDVVNTRRPTDLEAYRKAPDDAVTDQSPTATNIPVTLNQHVHTSFLLKDQDRSLSFDALVPLYINGAAIALARFLDRVVLGQAYQFLGNQIGTLGTLASANVIARLTECRAKMYKAPSDPWTMALSLNTEAAFLQNSAFYDLSQSGNAETQTKGLIGTKFGFNFFQAPNQKDLIGDTTLGSGAVDNAAGYPAGTATITVDGFGASEVIPGAWVTINGKVYHVTASNNATATTITLSPTLVAAVANDDAIAVADMAAVNLAAGYDAGWQKAMVINGADASNPIQVGQGLTFGTSTVKYAVVATNGTTSITLDRPLELTVAHATVVNLIPSGGSYNLFFHKDAMTLAVRPLAAPIAGAGAVASTVSYNGMTVRATIAYDSAYQRHRITLDFLAGIKVLTTSLGGVLLA